MSKTEFDLLCISTSIIKGLNDRDGQELQFLLEILLSSSLKDKIEVKKSFESKGVIFKNNHSCSYLIYLLIT
jgi:hypothetical protein